MSDLNLKSSYEFDLPAEQIARHPREPRDSARLMVVDGMHREDKVFRDIVDLVSEGDCIVVNDVRVVILILERMMYSLPKLLHVWKMVNVAWQKD